MKTFDPFDTQALAPQVDPRGEYEPYQPVTTIFDSKVRIYPVGLRRTHFLAIYKMHWDLCIEENSHLPWPILCWIAQKDCWDGLFLDEKNVFPGMYPAKKAQVGNRQKGEAKAGIARISKERQEVDDEKRKLWNETHAIIMEKASRWPYQYGKEHVQGTYQEIQNRISQPQYAGIDLHENYYIQRWYWDVLFPDEKHNFPLEAPQVKIALRREKYEHIYRDIRTKALDDPYNYTVSFVQANILEVYERIGQLDANGALYEEREWRFWKALWDFLFPDEKDLLPQTKHEARITQAQEAADDELALGFDTNSLLAMLL